MLAAILGAGLTEAQSVTVSDVSPERLEHLSQRYGVSTTQDSRAAVAGSDVIILAVKPQNLGAVAGRLRGALGPDQLVLSILAGTTVAGLNACLDHGSIVRAMPNAPAQIGRGMTVWAATAGATEQQRDRTRDILGAMGREVCVEDEGDIDRATAISGSGPAYVFYFVEALTDAAREIGLSADVAGKLVVETVLGAGQLVEESEREPAELRRMVTSAGGTTAAALSELEAGGFSSLIERAVRAAYQRAKELGKS